MSPDDFLFDQDLVDTKNQIKVAVTRVDADSDILVNIRYAAKYNHGPEVICWLSLDAADAVGRALIAAANAEEPELDPDRLREDRDERRSLAIDDDGEE